MYNSKMKQEQIFQILSKHYAERTVYAILSGTRKPKYEIILELYQQYNIPFTAWKDIKSFIDESLTKNENISTVSEDIK